MDKRKYSITGHMVVKNEDRWIWYAIMSVIDYLDKLIIFDTGSKDQTNRIIEEVLKEKKYSDKVIYEEWGTVSSEEFYKVRQKQIELTDTDYFMVIDGDEIWYRSSLEELDRILSEEKPALVATRFINVCGDIFHYRNESREHYCINGITGAITIRIYSMEIPGICCGGVYGVEGYIDKDGVAVQDGGYKVIVQKGKYFHTSLLNRSSLQSGDFSIKYRRAKFRADWDARFAPDFVFPEVFDIVQRPVYVKSPYKKDFSIIRMIYHTVHKFKELIRYE